MVGSANSVSLSLAMLPSRSPPNSTVLAALLLAQEEKRSAFWKRKVQSVSKLAVKIAQQFQVCIEDPFIFEEGDLD